MTTHTQTSQGPQYHVFWGNMNLGSTDTEQHARGVIRQHIARRQRRGGQRDSAATMRQEYRIEGK